MTTNIAYEVKSLEEIENRAKTIKLNVSESNNMYIVHKSITKQLSEKRQGSANCKTRSEVKGGSKKPWKQKGTGKARAGSIRSPLWRGGGVIFGPKTKKYNKKLNKKEKQLAIRNLLFNKKDFTIAIQQSFLDFNQPKTKLFLNNINKLNIENKARILIIVVKKDRNLYLATKNLSYVEIITANQLNLLSIIKTKYILIETDAIKVINEIYNG